MTDTKLLEAYARLTALRQHLPGVIPPELVNEFHEILGLLEQHGGVSLQSFRIPQSAIHPAKVQEHFDRWSTSPYTTTEPAYCDSSMFLMKIDGVLRLFELLEGARTSGKSPIGFKPPGS